MAYRRRRTIRRSRVSRARRGRRGSGRGRMVIGYRM